MIKKFDENAYLDVNIDVKDAIERKELLDAQEHLELAGLNEIAEGRRKFHKDFDFFNEKKYLETFPEVEDRITDGTYSTSFEHFCQVGYAEIIEGKKEWLNEKTIASEEEMVSALTASAEKEYLDDAFDEEYYVNKYPDIKDAGVDPGKHYFTKGWKEGRCPNQWFDPDYYLKTNEDVKKANIEPLTHYIEIGKSEGRSPMRIDISSSEVICGFDENAYLEANIDLKDAIERRELWDAQEHLELAGLNEIADGTRKFHKDYTPFDEVDYLKNFPKVKDLIKEKKIKSPFEHFVREGYLEIVSAKQLWYKKDEEIFILDGILRENIYHMFIESLDMSYYLDHNPDLLAAIENGTLENADIHFRTTGLHEIFMGKRKLMDGLGFYNELSYVENNDDIKKLFAEKNSDYISAFEHYLLLGYREILEGTRRELKKKEEDSSIQLSYEMLTIAQSGLFDVLFYVKSYPDIITSGMDPLLHYLTYGAPEGRKANRDFDTAFYMHAYPDVLESGINPLVHYIKYGLNEGRKTKNEDGLEALTFLPLPICDSSLPVNLKIAVVIHAFYIDVLEDIITSIDHISPQPDLFISVSEDADVEEIEAFLEKRGYPNFVITPVQNRGRDVAPFLVEFAEALKSYDVCCKIHGKKSLYGGSEQTNWRNHLYYNLLGSKEIVDDILSAFVENKKLGLLFSDNYGMIPYWGYTWLTNKGVVNGLLQRLHLRQLSPILDKTYIDYPAGTMFWFRPAAISQILDSGIGYEDFPEEPIGNDGTIAHGLERLFGYVTRLNGYDYIEQNRKLMRYTKNITHKNFNQHQAKTLETAKNIVSEKECVIFDIFDTLVTRTIYYPDNLFRIIEEEFDTAFSIKSDFMKVRKETEYQLRMSEEHEGDVSYEDIYDNIHLHSDYTPEMVKYLRTKDFEYELEILIPKPDAIELLTYAFEKNIEILFVSDMYLTKSQVMTILKKQSIPFKEENVMVSSDTGYRKDNTTVWKYLVDTKRIDPSKTLMIGDSEVSDAKLPGDFAIGTFHVLSERNAFVESPFGKAFSRQFGQLSEKEMLLMGPVVNQIFSSAFELSDTVLNFSKKSSPYMFGYTALAPFFYMFISNVYNKFSDKRIFFLARDGYFMQKAFEHFLETKKLSLKGDAKYLQISRRAMLGAVLKNEENLANMILDLGNYEGMFSAMIYSRVGLNGSFLKESGIEDFEINNTEGLEKAYELLVEHIDLINTHAKDENRAYKDYLESIGFFDESEDVLIDLGYSGTIQNYLHQLSGERLIGEYFVTTEKVKKIEYEKNQLKGYFADKIDTADNSNIVYKYALVLEAFLTSDKGQLICFTEEKGKITPQYKEKKESIEVQEKMMDGIRDYISALSIVPSDFVDTEDERLKAISLFTYEYMIKNRLIEDETLSIFHLEDEFTGNKALDIMTILTERGI